MKKKVLNEKKEKQKQTIKKKTKADKQPQNKQKQQQHIITPACICTTGGGDIRKLL